MFGAATETDTLQVQVCDALIEALSPEQQRTPPNSSTNHVCGLSRGLSRPLRTMIHLCGVLINHISLTQPRKTLSKD